MIQKLMNYLDPYIRKTSAFAITIGSALFKFIKESQVELKKSFKIKKQNKPINTQAKHERVELSFFKKSILSLMMMALFGLLVGVTYIYMVAKDAPELLAEDFVEQDSTKVLDKDGVVIAEIGTQIRTNIDYEQLPQVTIDAFVSIEDSRFFEHNGFDVPRFVKAMIENVLSFSFSQGGSTFTMQLVKGTYFETEDSLAPRSGLDGINRKIQEIALAFEAETIIDKERILEMYLNRINFGVPQNRRGIQTASEFYFGKDVSELNLVESAMLAGVINAPNAYNPIKSLELATQRTHVVLDLMVYHGYISQAEADLAKSIPIENLIVGELVSGVEASGAKPYQAYVDAVIQEVKEVTGFDPAQKSMTIYTSLDTQLQTHFESILNGDVESVAFPNDIIQSSMISLNQSTGEILAIGGGRYYYGERLFNRATDMFRQPGSSAKLILTYPLAFEHLGWSTQHILHDRPIIYAGTDVVIKNFDDVYRGDVSIAYAIGNSLNIPAIETMQNVDEAIGPEATIAYLNSLGFDQVNASNYDLGYGIGGSLFKASPLQMAQAYGAMLNAGQFNEAHTVLKIEYQDDIEDYVYQAQSKTVLSPSAAFITATMMEQDVSGPYRNFMQILDRSYAVYAKTGTSDWGDTGLDYGIPSGSAKDKWMIAGTSEITTAVWVGYDQAVKDQISYLDQAQINLNLPGKINSSILDAYYADKAKPKAILRPEGVVDITHVSGVYPYVYPTESTSPSLVVTGLVKEEFSQLVELASPVAFYQSVGVYNGEVLTGQVKGYDPYTSYLYFNVVEYPTHGQLTFDGSTGMYTYTHSGDEQADFFSFSASYSSPQRVDINILPKKETE